MENKDNQEIKDILTGQAPKPKLKPWTMLIPIALPLIAVGAYAYFTGVFSFVGGKDPGKSYREINWEILSELDYNTGKLGPRVAEVNDQFIRLPGFVVPLDDNNDKAAEFLLVPSPQACIHVPAPPANQMVLVTMMNNKPPPQRSWGPVWIKGRIKVSTSESSFGKVSYRIYAEDSEVYKMQY